ncbi:hypothetical protein KL86APRO_30191 [uncultured Alphaproteobacteria bacterium]|uniref:Uncharacterized protein n=1 Tax=uncultured Alphaproteobacteria bacterium TaxID=91750 RepID=A0A212KM29_9PROT|nr:hypothetical protein KL86APRO_30191 [uncultured Alphaproteobacteria bacterium]
MEKQMTPEQQEWEEDRLDYARIIGTNARIVVPDERNRLTLRRLLKKIGPALRGFFLGRGVPS